MELPKPLAISIIVVAVVLVLGIGLYTTGVIGNQPIPETESVKAAEAAERYQQYGGGTSSEFEARQNRSEGN
jgi:flagellar basal body-associated protein FliL